MIKINKLLLSFSLSAMYLIISSFTVVDDPKWYTQPFTTNSIAEPCYIPNTAFQHGEELVYKIYYNVNFVWVPAGELNMKVEDLGNQFHLKAVGSTYRSYDWFYTVRDYYDSYLDKSSLLPVVSVRDISEGKYKLYDKVVLDQTKRQATSYRGSHEHNTKRSDFKLSDCMHDIFSILYYCRNIDFNTFSKGATFPIKVMLDEKEYPLSVKYQGKQSKKHVKDMGHYKTIQFSPQLIDGRVFKEGSELNLWVSDDANKIPLLIESPLSV
ncbi:MAG: DUF3108 domain-containing protein, partial [Saprospiraceae bacterium]